MAQKKVVERLTAGIDIGGTNTHGVLMQRGRIKSVFTVEGRRPPHAVECFDELRSRAGSKEIMLALTGGGARRMAASDFPIPFTVVDEIRAIGKGGVFLSGKRNLFVVSIGTGTAFVSVNEGEPGHIGGTGIGGGTIYGLSQLMLQMRPSDVEKTARKSARNLDISVKEIVGGSLGKVPGDATASNFGKADYNSDKPEIAASLLNMIGESIGLAAYFAAKTTGQERYILLSGRVAVNCIVKKKAMDTIKMFGGRAVTPKNAEYCAAIGACLEAATG